jgi:release factor glutamine methyltransferase
VPPELVTQLRRAGCAFAEDEARLLIGQARDPDELAAMVERRLLGLPLEQVLGWAEFGGLRVMLEPGVFVPRRRTELLAELAVVVAAAATPATNGCPVVVELCCGSGAVSAVVLAALDRVELHSCDLDPVAVRCARGNLGERAHVSQGDLYAALPARLAGHVDVLVANAPHVPDAELALMPREARLHEPPAALAGGVDGLDVLRVVIAGAPGWLAAGGALLVECGAPQVIEVAGLMDGAGLRVEVVHSQERGATVLIGRSGGAGIGSGAVRAVGEPAVLGAVELRVTATGGQ